MNKHIPVPILNSNAFLRSDNVEMIWDLILDENVVQGSQIEQTKQIFTEQIQLFNHTCNMNIDLFEKNKQFIQQFITRLNTKQHHNDNSRQKLVRAEDIKADRLSLFEQELSYKKNEFSNAVATKKPQTPDFSEKRDEKIDKMEDLITEMLAQRKYDIEKIQQSNINKESVEDFLRTSQTSINTMTNKNIPPPQREIKYIKIDASNDSALPLEADIIDLSPANSNSNTNNTKKHISWESDVKENSSSTQSLFSKLKSLPEKKRETNQDIVELHIKLDLLMQRLDDIFNIMLVKK